MKIKKNQKLELCASRDNHRGILQFINIVPKDRTGKFDGKATLEATNAMALVVVPTTLEKGDEAGLIHASQFEKIRKLPAQSHSEKHISTCNLNKKWIRYKDISERLHMEERIRYDAIYPNIASIVPNEKSGPVQYTISLDAALLADVQEAMGTRCVTLVFRGNTDPIEVNPGKKEEGYGIIMPTRTN